MSPPLLKISPALVNSANPWATSLEDLKALYECPNIGAVTTRTSLIAGFAHDPSRHQFTLFDTATHESEQDRTKLNGRENASLNTLGYSPHTLEVYLEFIRQIAETPAARPDKGFIVSVTGSPGEVAQCYSLIAQYQKQILFPLAMEVNLSCPNIPDKPPPAYNGDSLRSYLKALQGLIPEPDGQRIPFGLKTPPYTHAAEYVELFSALKYSAQQDRDGVCPVSFITATNTLGSCLVLADPGVEASSDPALPALGIGGMAGAPIHPLALGNVRTIRRLLEEAGRPLAHVQIIGVGGVLDHNGYKRMQAAGATIVGVGTGLGLKGVGVFDDILNGV